MGSTWGSSIGEGARAAEVTKAGKGGVCKGIRAEQEKTQFLVKPVAKIYKVNDKIILRPCIL